MSFPSSGRGKKQMIIVITTINTNNYQLGTYMSQVLRLNISIHYIFNTYNNAPQKPYEVGITIPLSWIKRL